MGFRKGHGLRFDPRIVAKNDYDVSAMNAYKHRRCLRNARYTFCQKDYATARGGLSAFRNSQTEKDDVAILKKKWGDVFNFGGHSGTRKRDYLGTEKITLNLPF